MRTDYGCLECVQRSRCEWVVGLLQRVDPFSPFVCPIYRLCSIRKGILYRPQYLVFLGNEIKSRFPHEIRHKLRVKCNIIDGVRAAFNTCTGVFTQDRGQRRKAKAIYRAVCKWVRVWPNNWKHLLQLFIIWTLRWLWKVVIQKTLLPKWKKTNARIHVCLWKKGRYKPFSLLKETLRIHWRLSALILLLRRSCHF